MNDERTKKNEMERKEDTSTAEPRASAPVKVRSSLRAGLTVFSPWNSTD